MPVLLPTKVISLYTRPTILARQGLWSRRRVPQGRLRQRIMLRVRHVLTLLWDTMLIQPKVKQSVPQVRGHQGILPLEHHVQTHRRVITSRTRVDGTRILVQPGSIKMLLDNHPVRMRASVMSSREPEDGIRIIAIRYGGRRNIRMLRDKRRVRHTPSKTAHI